MESTIYTLLQQLGEDPEREGLKETPARVARMWKELVRHDEPPELTTFPADRDGVHCDEMVLLTDIQFNSLCEHHLLPFIGTAHVGYIPGKKVIGLSKIPRVVRHFAHRLQIQERLTVQIVDHLFKELEPLGVCVVMTAEHLCMSIRGVEDPHSNTTTHAIRGNIDKNEFLQLVQMAQRKHT